MASRHIPSATGRRGVWSLLAESGNMEFSAEAVFMKMPKTNTITYEKFFQMS